MSADWPITTVGQVATKVTKGTTPTSIGGGFADAGINFVKVESITADGRIDPAKLAKIDDRSNQLLSRSMLAADDVLFTIAGTIGRAALVEASLLPANTNQAVAIVRPRMDRVLPRFLYFVLRDEERVRQANTRVVQSVQANFSLAELGSLEFSLPPIHEQRAIADALGTLDDKIELNRRMSETLEAMARALFKSWFVDFDPVRAKAEGRDPGLPQPLADLFPDSFEDSELGEIPAGWKVGSLSDLATLNPEVWSRATRPSRIRYIDLSNTKRGRIEATTVFDTSDQAPSRAQRVARKGDTLVGTVRPGNGSYALVLEDGLTASTGFAQLRPVGDEARCLVYLAATSSDNIESLAHLADGAAYPAVRPEVVAATRVVVPLPSMLVAFEQTAAPLLDASQARHSESETLARLRDALLPKLVSGEVRVGSSGGTGGV